MNLVGFCFLFILGCINASCYAKENTEVELQLSGEPLLVSLGSTCEPAHMFRLCELRKTAFPFDWIVSFDGKAIIELLENNFEDFFNEKYFVPYGPGHLVQARYHLEFLHDGDFNQQFDLNFAKLKEKYSRRIQRFRNLNDYIGKVFFVRCACRASMTSPLRFYRFKDNLELTEDYALRLYQALKFFFPKLDFDLIIINCSDGESFEEEKTKCDHVRIFKIHPELELQKKIESYKAFFKKLIDVING